MIAVHDLPYNGQLLNRLLDGLDHPIRNAVCSQLRVGQVVEILLMGDAPVLQFLNQVIDLLRRQAELLGCHGNDLFYFDGLLFDSWLVFLIVLALVHGHVFWI